MQLSQLTAFVALAATALASPELRAANAQCWNNLDTAWWKPPGDIQTKPTTTIQDICDNGSPVGGCQQGYGRLCVYGDLRSCRDLIAAVQGFQKFNKGRWEFPSSIQCGNIALSVASTP